MRSSQVYLGPRDPDKLDQYDPTTEDWSNEGTGRRIMYSNFTTIERIRLKHLRELRGWKGKLKNMYDSSQAWIIVSLVGISCGLTACFITVSAEWLNDLKFGYCSSSWYLNQKFCCWQYSDDACPHWKSWASVAGVQSDPDNFALSYFVYVFIGTLFAFISACLVKKYSPYAAGSGIPEVKTILSGFIIRKFLGVWTLVVKSVGLSLSVASGLCVGKEGPLVHVACCFGNIFPRFFDKYCTNEAKKREILSAASAAGVSVAFGAPIGGVLFSLEEVSYYFPNKTLWRSFFSATIAAVTLQLMNPFRTNQLVLFQVTYSRELHAFELFGFILLGLLGVGGETSVIAKGLYGALFIRMNLWINAWRSRSWLGKHPILEVVIVALLTTVVSYANIYSRVNMSELVGHLFRECEMMSDAANDRLCDIHHFGSISLNLILVGTLKMLLTTITFGVRVPAGIFIPSMAVGACFGRVVGIGMQMIQESHPDWSIFSTCPKNAQCITPGTYAMVGAAASLGGVTRMTVSLVVIMYELTGALTYVLPIMISVMVAKWVGDAFGRESIYDGLVRLNKYPFLDSKADYAKSTVVSDLMTPIRSIRFITASGHTIDTLEDLLSLSQTKGFPVVRSAEDLLLLGYAGRAEIQFALKQAKKTLGVTGATPCSFLPRPSSAIESEGESSLNSADASATVFSAPPPPRPPQDNLDDEILIDTSSTAANSLLPPQESAETDSATHSSNHTPVPYPAVQLNTETIVDFRPWIDITPVTVSPRFPMEIVLEIFKKMGLRYVIITHYGRLRGILTKKDILTHLHDHPSQQVDSDAHVADLLTAHNQ